MMYGKNEAITLVAGADLSGQQFKFVNNAAGAATLAGSETDPVGIVDNKPLSGEHATVVVRGGSKLYIVGSVNPGDKIGASNATSGAGVRIGSGGHHVGHCIVAATSGGIASVQLTNLPAYLAK